MVDWDADLKIDWLKGGSSERNRLLENLPIIAMFFFMFLIMLPQIPALIKPYLLFFGLGSAVLVGAVSEWALKVKASEYLAIEAIVRPTNKKYYLFIQEPRSGLSSRCVDPAKHWFSTPLPLAEKIEYEEFGMTSLWELEHEWDWEKRMHFVPGYVTYKGCPGIRHNKVARIIIWEPKEVKGRLDTSNDYPEYIPRFILSEGPRDYFIQDDPSELATPYASLGEGISDQQIIVENQNLRNENNNLKSQITAIKTASFNEQQSSIRVRNIAGQTFNAFMGQVAQEPDVDKIVQTKFTVWAHRYSNMIDAKNALFGKWSWPKIGMWTAILCIGLGFLALLGINKEFQQQVFANLGLLILGVCGYLVLVYLVKTKVKL